MRPTFFAVAMCALCALACSRQSDRETTPPPGTTHVTPQDETTIAGTQETDRGPIAEDQEGAAPGPRSASGQPAEEKEALATGTEGEMQRVGGALMTEANVVAALIASNEYEVRVGEMMAGKSTQADVKRFAKMLIKDHGGALKKIDAMRGKLKVAPEENDAIRQMRDDADQKVARLAGMSGNDLDRTFLENAVEDHQKTLERIDADFLPAVQNAELRTFITKMKPTVEHHRDEAQKLLDKLK